MLGSKPALITSLLMVSTIWKPSCTFKTYLYASVVVMDVVVTWDDFSSCREPQAAPNSGVEIGQGRYAGA